MMSPETYYEMYLKGKSRAETQFEIVNLKKDIKNITNRIESCTASDYEAMSAYQRTLDYKKKYLHQAIKSLVKMQQNF